MKQVISAFEINWCWDILEVAIAFSATFGLFEHNLFLGWKWWFPHCDPLQCGWSFFLATVQWMASGDSSGFGSSFALEVSRWCDYFSRSWAENAIATSYISQHHLSQKPTSLASSFTFWKKSTSTSNKNSYKRFKSDWKKSQHFRTKYFLK